MKKLLIILSLLICVTGIRAEITKPMSTIEKSQGIKLPEELKTRIGLNSIRPFESGKTNNLNLLPQKKLFPDNASSLFGYLYATDDSANINGLYEIGSNDLTMLYVDDLLQLYWITPINGWYRDGKVCGLTMVIDENAGYIYGYVYYELDFETGQLIKLTDLELVYTMFLTCTLNPENDTIYGYVIDLQTGEYYWATAPLSNPSSLNMIQKVTGSECYSICYNPDNGGLYGLNALQQFVRIDSEGNQTVINGDIEGSNNFLDFYAGLTWDASSRLFYANVNLANRTSRIYSVTTDGVFDLIKDYGAAEQFSFFFTANDKLQPDQPEAPKIESVKFEGASLTGEMTFTLPLLFGNGDPLPSSIEYTVTIDGVDVQKDAGKPGDKITVSLSVESEGMHSFGVYVTEKGVNSPRVTKNIYIGNDTPNAPQNVKLAPELLTWDAVTTGVNGGYVDANAVSYEIYINDSYFDTTTDTFIDPALGENQLMEYRASVIAVCNGLKGKPGISNVIVAGDALIPPVFILPTLEETALMTVIDNNRDGDTWRYSTLYEAVHIGMSERGRVDDYLFLPPIRIDDIDDYYTFSVRGALDAVNMTDEYFDVVYATAPRVDAVLGTIIKDANPTTTYSWSYDWDIFEGLWRVSEPGVYYIGIHCKSYPRQWGLYVNRFNLEKSIVNDNSPTPVRNLTAIPAEKGVLEATLSFTLPDKTMNGTSYSPNTELRAIVELNDEILNDVIIGNPGEDITRVFETIQGTNTFMVTVAEGTHTSAKESVNVYTGVSVPSEPQNIKGFVGPDMMTATISWDPVTTTPMEDGYLDPENVVYLPYLQYANNGIYYWIPLIEDTFISETTYTLSFYDIVDPYSGYVYANAPQAWYNLSVSAYNEAGSTNYVGYPVTLYMGRPFTLPYEEKFDNPRGTYSNSTTPWTPYISVGGVNMTAGWSSIPVGNSYALSGFPGATLPSNGAIGMPRFSTKNMENAELTVSLRVGPNSPKVTLYGEIYGSYDLSEIGSIDGATSNETEFESFTFTLPERLLDEYWVQIYVIVEYTSSTQTFAMNRVYVSGTEAGVNMPESICRIYGEKGLIRIQGLEDKNVAVYSIDGKQIFNGFVENNDFGLPTAKGIYIVNANGVTSKVLVK